MEYNTKTSHLNDNIDIQTIFQYVIRVLQKWWIILLCAVICGTIGYIVGKTSYTPTYTSTMRFVIDNKGANTSMAGQSSSDINAGIILARNYVNIMTETNSLMNIVAENSGCTKDGAPLTGKDVKGMIRSSLVEDTSIIVIGFTSPDPEVSYAVALSYVNNYSKVTDKAYQSTRAILIDEPVKAERANSSNRHTYLALGGFALGASIVILAMCLFIFIKDTVKLPEDITNRVGQKIIGSVVHLKKSQDSAGLLITDKKMGFMFIESFKLKDKK